MDRYFVICLKGKHFNSSVFFRICRQYNKIVYFYFRVSGIIHNISLIFFVYPGPKGSEENQFTPLGVGVNKLIFKRFCKYY